MTVLAVFRSRSQALDYLSRLRSTGVPAQAVNTPALAGVGCGISVRFTDNFISRARVIAEQNYFSSFAGFFAEGRYL